MRSVEYELSELLKPVTTLDWTNVEAAETETKLALKTIRDTNGLLEALVNNLLVDEVKLKKCEKDYNIEKYVLFSDAESGIRLRLHVMYPHSGDIPHSHRMNFTSLILHGAYCHTLYSQMDNGDVLFDARDITPVYIKNEITGVPYYIDHKVIHNLRVVGEEKCISLMLRSPPQKRRAIHYDFGTGSTWWRYGSTERTVESLRNTTEIIGDDVKNLASLLKEYRVI